MGKRVRWGLLGCALVLGGCVNVTQNAEIPGGCMAYDHITFLVVAATTDRGCVTQLNAHWRVTAKHVLIDWLGGVPKDDPSIVLDPGHDLAFIRHDGVKACDDKWAWCGVARAWRAPVFDEAVTASGNKIVWGRKSLSAGHAGRFDRFCPPPLHGETLECSPGVFTSAVGGQGFSGGPLIAANGDIVGIITMGYRGTASFNGHSFPPGTMVGYPGDFVMSEFRRLVPEENR